MTYPHVEVLERGDAGTENTVRAMIGLARRAVAHMPAVPGAPWRIRELLAHGFEFEPDPPGAELVRDPVELLEELRQGRARGDCDDVAVLGAALGIASGYRARFRLVGFDAAAPFAHVWTELLDDFGGVEDLDIFRPREMPPGLSIAREAIVEV